MTRKELDVLFKQHVNSLYRLAFSYVKEKDIAEDVVQNAFIKTWDNRDKISNPYQFLRKSVVNAALNEIRNDERRKNIEETYIDIHAVDDIPVEEFCEKHERLKKAINNLSEDIRKTIILRCIQELKYLEIAEDLNISKDTVKSRLTKGFRKIKEEFIIVLIILLSTFFKNI